MGNIVNWEKVAPMLKKKGILILEDSADTLGATYKNKSTGKINKVTFGARGMSIKKSIPARQRSFLARMGGVLKEVKGQKSLSPAFWSIKAWKKDFPL